MYICIFVFFPCLLYIQVHHTFLSKYKSWIEGEIFILGGAFGKLKYQVYFLSSSKRGRM
jgi:hypothetical protein